jgi:hypothetical protein
MTRRTRKVWFVLCALGIGGLSLLLYDRLFGILWCGTTDVTMVVIVTDERTGKPIEGAEVIIGDSSDFDGNVREVALRTGPDGIASHHQGPMFCDGHESGLGFTNRVYVDTLGWGVTVSAQGYMDSGRIAIDQPPHQLIPSPTKRGRQLIIPIALRKSLP